MAFVDEHGGVEGWFAILSVGRKGDASKHGNVQLARCRSQLVHGRAAARQEAGLLKKVGGRIAADGELGKDRKARALFRRAAAGGNDLLEVSGKITNRGVDLGQRDLHNSILNRTVTLPSNGGFFAL